MRKTRANVAPLSTLSTLTKQSTLALLVAIALSGCVGNGQGEETDRASQFGKKEFESAMKESGKSAELDEAKRKEQEYLAAQGGIQDEQR